MISTVFLMMCFVVLATFVICVELRSFSREKRSGLRPWQINQGICPPSLCPLPQPLSLALGVSQPAAEPVPFQFFEGDIVLGERQTRALKEARRERSSRTRQRRRDKRAAVRGVTMLWPNGIVPFKIDSELTSKVKKHIRRAHEHIMRETCVRFTPATEDDTNYVYYVNEPGCWSYIGVQKGAQRIALGYGCDKFGTVVHETVHALGFWHEQSRRDRDRYVNIIKRNISPLTRVNFEKLTKKLQNSRGYPYDYSSIMHYASDYFSTNGEPTIEVIGIGKKLKFSIGQRIALSELDIAQLRDMYRCNKQIKGCPEGWVRNENSCYKFVLKPKQFAGAGKECHSENARLVSIDDSTEDAFLTNYLENTFPEVTEWRTGGKRYDSSVWIWHHRDRRHRQMRYHRFGPGQPGKYTTLVLAKDMRDGRLRWQGTWAGSVKDIPQYAFPFICEKVANKTCKLLRYTDGRDYRGTLDYTASGVTCQRWDSQYPHQHSVYSAKAIDNHINGIVGNNYCRNPYNLRRQRPWCYTTKSKKTWEYCDIEKC